MRKLAALKNLISINRYLHGWTSRRVQADINGALRMVLGHTPALHRTRAETGYSLQQIIERCDTIAEASRQSGRCPATVRKYRERWM
jgi:hypothetical protein